MSSSDHRPPGPLLIGTALLAAAIGPPGTLLGAGRDDPSREAPAPIEEAPAREEREDGRSWLDRFHDAVSTGVTAAARWFDGLFGDARADEENRTAARVLSDVLWSERDDLELAARFKLRVRLPVLERRLDAFVGRVTDDEFVSEGNDGFEGLPEVFSVDEEDDTLAGLGYSPIARGKTRLSFDGGVKVESPLDPFVKLRVRRSQAFGPRTLFRVRETLFWTYQQGVGETSRFDLDRLISRRFLARWASRATFSESTRGLEWESGLTFYQPVRQRKALAYRARMGGETDGPVTVESLGLQVLYRQALGRGWLFLDLRAGVAWPKDLPDDPRAPSIGVGAGLEIQFSSTPD